MLLVLGMSFRWMLLVVRGLLGVVIVLRVIGSYIVRGILGGIVARIHLIDVLVLHCSGAS